MQEDRTGFGSGSDSKESTYNVEFKGYVENVTLTPNLSSSNIRIKGEIPVGDDIFQRLQGQQKGLYGREKAWVNPLDWLHRDSNPEVPLQDYVDLQIDIVDVTKSDKSKKSIELVKIFGEKRKPAFSKCMFFGACGFGKTTLCKKLLYDWARQEDESPNYVSQFKLAFYIQLRRVSHKESIEDLFYNEILRNNPETDKSVFQHILHQVKSDVLFVLDGMDEIPRDFDATDLVHSFCRKYPLATIVTTSRVRRGLSKADMKHMFDKTFEVRGFSPANVDKFIRLYLCDNKDKISQINEIKRNSDVSGIFECPLLLYLFCFQFKRSESIPRTIPELYHEVFAYLAQIANKKRTNTQRSFPENFIPKDERRALLRFGKATKDCIVDDIMIYSEADMICWTGEDWNIINKIGILTKVDGPDKCYQPLHATFLEYLTAFYLASLVDGDEEITRQEFELFYDDMYVHRGVHENFYGRNIANTVLFMFRILGENAYKAMKFFPVQQLRSNVHWSIILNECGHNQMNIEQFIRYKLGNTLETEWIMENSYNIDHRDVKHLCAILSSQNNKIERLLLDPKLFVLLAYSRYEVIRQILKAVILNTSILYAELHLTKAYPHEIAPELVLKSIPVVIANVCQIPCLEELVIRADMFAFDAAVRKTVILYILDHIRVLPKNLKTLEFRASDMESKSLLCNGFHNTAGLLNYQDTTTKFASPYDMIKKHHINRLSELLENGNQISKLNLSGLMITNEENIESARKLFTLLPNLEELILHYFKADNSISKMEFHVLTKLKSLDLRFSYLSNEDFEGISNLLKSVPKLTTLNLAECLTKEIQLQSLFEGIAQGNLDHLNVASKLEISEDLLYNFLSAVQSGKVSDLVISGWSLSLTSVDGIARLCNTISKLCLHSCKLKLPQDLLSNGGNGEGANNFHDSLETLTFLDIRGCEVMTNEESDADGIGSTKTNLSEWVPVAKFNPNLIVIANDDDYYKHFTQPSPKVKVV